MALRQEVVGVWESTVGTVAETIRSTFINSRAKFEKAYNVAFHCHHGCHCEFIEKEYDNLTSQRAELESKIAILDGEIEAGFAQIDIYEEGACDFSVFDAKYSAIWADLEAEHNMEVEALADWMNDGYEL